VSLLPIAEEFGASLLPGARGRIAAPVQERSRPVVDAPAQSSKAC